MFKSTTVKTPFWTIEGGGYDLNKFYYTCTIYQKDYVKVLIEDFN